MANYMIFASKKFQKEELMDFACLVERGLKLDVSIFVISDGTFKYADFFKSQILKKKMDHSYRVFKKVNRDAVSFPHAMEYSWGDRPIQVWCSNDYLGMSAHPQVKGAVM